MTNFNKFFEETDSFEAKINKTETHWFWTGAIDNDGYGKYRGYGAHVVSWIRANKKQVPDNCQIHHTCRLRHCVNPEHLKCLDTSFHQKLHAEEKKSYEFNYNGFLVKALHKDQAKVLAKKEIWIGDQSDKWGIVADEWGDSHREYVKANRKRFAKIEVPPFSQIEAKPGVKIDDLKKKIKETKNEQIRSTNRT